MSAVLEAPPQFTKTATQLNDLKRIREVRFELTDEENLRLQENQCVIDHYNAANSLNQNINSSVKTPSDTLTNNADQLESTTGNNTVLCTPKKGACYISQLPKKRLKNGNTNLDSTMPHHVDILRKLKSESLTTRIK